MPHFTNDQIRTIVRDAYGHVKSSGTDVAETFYDPAELARLPRAVAELALGVGHPLRRADLSPGEVVLDIGCGAGIDTLLAAIAVGRTGKVIGLDMTPEMLERAREHAVLAGLEEHVEIVHGLAESIPLEDESVDVVISNGVLNLCNRKSRVIAEIARVLRPGGRVSIADLVVTDRLPDEILKHPAAVAG